MRISHRYKFMFFSNPKTGSGGMRAFLNPVSDIRDVQFGEVTPINPFYSHIRPIEARAEFQKRGWKFEDYYRFTAVRNPWTKLVSLYYMIRRSEPAFAQSFPEWLKNSRVDGEGGGGPDRHRWRKYGTYTLANFAGDAGGALLVDEVFRLEDIADFSAALAKRCIPVSTNAMVPRVKQSLPPAAYIATHTPETLKIVAERYASEIERFGYTFDDLASGPEKVI